MAAEKKPNALKFNLGAHCYQGEGCVEIPIDHQDFPSGCRKNIFAIQNAEVISDLYTSGTEVKVELSCDGCKLVPGGFRKIVTKSL